MQQKKKEQYEGALESIFDFIFEESQKPPSKVKPVKATGVDGTTEMIDAIGSILANPLLFVNDETIQAFKDGMDVAPLQLRVGDRPTDSFKFKASDVGDILKDPGSWVDGQFKKLEAIRKTQKATWAGEELKGALGYLWAKDRGLDKEARSAMLGAGRKGARATGASYEYMLSRTRDLGSRYLEDLKDENLKKDLIDRYGNDEKRAKKEYYKQIKERALKKFGEVRGKKMGEAFEFWDDNPDEAVHKEGVYYTLESQSLREKAVNSLRKGDKEKAEDYTRASNHILRSYDQRYSREYINKQKKLLRDYSKKMAQLRKSSDPDKDKKIKELKRSKNLISSQVNQTAMESLAGGIGKAEGWYYSVKNMYTGRNLLPNIINGKFFNDNYNSISWLQPAEGDEFRGVDFLRAKDKKGDPSKGRKGDPLGDAYCKMTMPLYYLSPATWARSLTNGEIFAYAGHLQREVFKASEVVNQIKGFNVEKFLKDLDKGRTEYLDSIVEKITDDQMKQLEKFMKRDKFWGDMAYVFSTASRVKAEIEEFVRNKVLKKVREQVGKVLLDFVKDKVAKELIKSWVAKGGIKVLIKGLVTSVASAIGLAGTPVASVVIGAVTWVFSEVVYQVGKVTIKFSLVLGRAVLFGFIGLFLLIVSMMVAFGGIFGKHSHVAPHEVVMCDAYSPIDIPEEEAEGNCPNCLTNIRINNTSHIPSKATVTRIIDGWVQECPLGGYPEVCYEDVYCRALKYGIDPAFAFTIWSNESGGSNYANVPDVQDFGINLSAIEADFDAQIEHFLQKIAIPDYASGCSWQSIDTQGLDPTIIKWGTRFLTGACAGSSAAQLEMGRDYMLKISTIYNWYTNKTLSWPFTVPADSGACDYSSAQVNNVYNSCNQKAQGYCDGSGSGGSSGGEDINFESRPGEAVESLFNRMASEMGLSGAQLGLISPGHELYGDLDGGWWCWAYSMNQVYCKSDKVTSSNDYIVKLFKHELTHLRQYRNASGSYGSLFMEWGADWVSGNGGGYSFTTKNGTCIKATETPMLPGCSSEAYRGIAYNEESYLSSQCFGSLKSYITGFCGSP